MNNCLGWVIVGFLTTNIILEVTKDYRTSKKRTEHLESLCIRLDKENENLRNKLMLCDESDVANIYVPKQPRFR